MTFQAPLWLLGLLVVGAATLYSGQQILSRRLGDDESGETRDDESGDDSDDHSGDDSDNDGQLVSHLYPFMCQIDHRVSLVTPASPFLE